MVQMISHDCCGVVQKVRDLLLVLALERLLHQLDVVAPACLDEDLLCGGALWGGSGVSTGLSGQGQPACWFAYIVFFFMRHREVEPQPEKSSLVTGRTKC